MAAVLFSRIISLLFTLLCPLDWLNMMWWSPRTAWFLKRSRFRKRMLRSPVRTPSLWYDMLTAEFIWMIYHYLSCRISDAHGRTIISLTGQDYQDLSIYKLIEFCPCKYCAGGRTSFVCCWSLWALNAICLLTAFGKWSEQPKIKIRGLISSDPHDAKYFNFDSKYMPVFVDLIYKFAHMLFLYLCA